MKPWTPLLSYVLFVPGKIPTLNECIAAAKGSGGRGMAYARLKREWTDKVALLARAAKLPRFKRVRIAFNWVEADRRRDPDGFTSGGRKAILDGLVMAGVLPDDGWNEIDGWEDHWSVAPRKAGVGVLVTIVGIA